MAEFSAMKVSEIFMEASKAFNMLSEMTILLHPVGDPQYCVKWTEEEIEMLRSCVHRFSVDLNKVTAHMKNKTVSLVRTAMTKKVFNEAGIPVKQVTSLATNHTQMQTSEVPPYMKTINPMLMHHTQTKLQTNAEVTLNMLNAVENEEDDDDLCTDINSKSIHQPRK